VKIKSELFNLLRESSYKQLEVQNSSVESIETKTTSLLAAILAIPTILITIFTISGIRPNWNLLLTSGSLLMLLSATLLVISLLCRDFSMPAEIELFLVENKKVTLNQIRVNFLDDCRKSIAFNIKRLKQKGRYFNFALIFFVFSVLLIISGIIEGDWFNMKKDNSQQSGTQIQQTQQVEPKPLSQPSDSPSNEPTEASDSGLPDDRQGTTLNIFKGSDEYIKK
jgi:hypothetical protein